MIGDDTKSFFGFLCICAIVVVVGSGWGAGMALIDNVAGRFLYTALYAITWFVGCLFVIGEGNLKQGVAWFGPHKHGY